MSHIDFYPGEFLADVAGLTPAEAGLYWIIHCLVYSSGRFSIEDDAEWLASYAAESSAKQVLGLLNGLATKGKIIRIAAHKDKPPLLTVPFKNHR